MKLLIFGIEFDFAPMVGMLHAFTGLALIMSTFFIFHMGWWNILYALVAILYLSSAEHITERLIKCL